MSELWLEIIPTCCSHIANDAAVRDAYRSAEQSLARVAACGPGRCGDVTSSMFINEANGIRAYLKPR